MERAHGDHNKQKNVTCTEMIAVERKCIISCVDGHKSEEDINDLADAFIKKFRNQLRIQRHESFKRFQEMLARGT